MVRKLILEKLKEATGINDVHLIFSDRLEHGDYTTNAAMQKGNIGAGDINPRARAEHIVNKLKEDVDLKEYVSKMEIAGPGFINFFLSEKFINTQISDTLEQGIYFPEKITNKGKVVVVEYSSPNIAKPFTIGHLRSTIIGDSIANLLESIGYTVKRDNHLGDWGTQFGKQIYALKTWGDESKIDKSENPVKDLVALYVKFHEEAEKDTSLEDEARLWFKKLEEGDSEAKRIWQKCIDWSLKEFSRIYKELNVAFTENDGQGYGESYFSEMMPQVIAELRDKKLLVKGEEGAELVFFDNEKYPPLMILKKDGTSLYATRDLAADKFRIDQNGPNTQIINEVGGEQALYFSQLYEVERMLGWVTQGQRVHIKHGLFRFKDKKMSTRKGNVVWLNDVLSEAFEKSKSLGSSSDNYKEVATGALKWNELKRDPTSDIIFDWDEILNMKGNSGPYMQYTVVRAKGILKKANKEVFNNIFKFGSEEQELVRMLVKFPEIVSMSAANYSTSTLCTYLYEVAQAFNSYYDKVKIVGTKEEEIRLSVVKAVTIILTNGLNLLGITVPEKM